MKLCKDSENLAEAWAKSARIWIVSFGPILLGDSLKYLESFSWLEARKCLGKLADRVEAALHHESSSGCWPIEGQEAVYVVCRSKAEAMDLFDEIVGDDGPTARNSYNGPYRCYACVYGPKGMITENT